MSDVETMIQQAPARIEREVRRRAFNAFDGLPADGIVQTAIEKFVQDARRIERQRVIDEVNTAVGRLKTAHDAANQRIAQAEFRLQLAQTPKGYKPDPHLTAAIARAQYSDAILALYRGADTDAARYQIETEGRQKLETFQVELHKVADFDLLAEPYKRARTQREQAELDALRTAYKAATEEWLRGHFAAQDFAEAAK